MSARAAISKHGKPTVGGKYIKSQRSDIRCRTLNYICNEGDKKDNTGRTANVYKLSYLQYKVT